MSRSGRRRCRHVLAAAMNASAVCTALPSGSNSAPTSGSIASWCTETLLRREKYERVSSAPSRCKPTTDGGGRNLVARTAGADACADDGALAGDVGRPRAMSWTTGADVDDLAAAHGPGSAVRGRRPLPTVRPLDVQVGAQMPCAAPDLDRAPLRARGGSTSSSPGPAGRLVGASSGCAGPCAGSCPTRTRGTWSMNSTRRTFLCGATRSATHAMRSSASRPSSRRTTNALGTSSPSSSRTPITAASCTSGCVSSSASSSAGGTW